MMNDKEILSLITGEFSKLNDRLEKIEKFFPTVKNRPKRKRKSAADEYYKKSLSKVLK